MRLLRLYGRPASVLAAVLIGGVCPAVAWSAPPLPRSFAVTDLGPRTQEGLDLNDAGQVVGTGSEGAYSWTAGALTFFGATTATGINASGAVVGTRDPTPSTGTAVVFERGTVRVLPSLGGPDSWGTAMNDRGQVAGGSLLRTGESRAVVWCQRRIVDIATRSRSPMHDSTATDINNRGDVAGNGTFASRYRGFLYQRGVVTELSTLGGDDSVTEALNDRGVVVGASPIAPNTPSESAPNHAALWQGTTVRDLGTLAKGDLSGAYDINEAGLVVGYSTTTPGPEPFDITGFISDGQRMVDLSRLVPRGWHIEWPSGINDRGQITGYATHNGTRTAVLLTPRA
jgi:uncharacterized membrane protein